MGYCLLFAGSSLWAVHLNFAYFYATKNTKDEKESAFVTQLIVIYLLVVTIINFVANALGFFNKRKRAFIIGLLLSIVADISFSVCYYYNNLKVAKGVLFVCILTNAGVIGPAVFSMLTETLSSGVMVLAYSTLNLVFFMTNMVYPYIMKRTEDFGIYMYGMIVLAGIGIAGIVITAIFVAETGGKTKK